MFSGQSKPQTRVRISQKTTLRDLHECELVGGMGMVAIVVGVYRGGDGSNSRGCEGGDG